jgi:hypothetical protein
MDYKLKVTPVATSCMEAKIGCAQTLGQKDKKSEKKFFLE